MREINEQKWILSCRLNDKNILLDFYYLIDCAVVMLIMRYSLGIEDIGTRLSY